MTDDLQDAFDKAMNEPEEAKPERPTHIHGTMRANLARALAEAEGISLGEAVARVMADEKKNPSLPVGSGGCIF